ncbi:MAG: imelysin family protein [Hyphomicrobiaceae bacterium]|nr:imelysin family protein [Hyphomicrobiaceae bacterium]
MAVSSGVVWTGSAPAVMAADGAREMPAGALERAAPSHAAMVDRAIRDVVLPRVGAFRARADRLADVTAAWCDGPGASAATAPPADPPAEVVDAFRAAATEWAGIEYLRFGPLRDANRVPRISFWPDPRGVVRRQVAKALADRDADLVADGGIARQSAAVQGLPAIEVLLDAPADVTSDANGYRCRLVAAMAANVAKLAGEVDVGWRSADGWAHRMRTAGPGNAAYHTDAEAAAELLKALLAGLQIVGEQEITPWIDAAQKRRAWAGLPFERSGLSQAYVASAVASLRELHQALRLDAVARKLGADGQSWIVGWLDNAYGTLTRDSAALRLPAVLAAEEAADIDHLRRVKFYSNGLRQIIGRQIAPGANLLIGFNDLDGD